MKRRATSRKISPVVKSVEPVFGSWGEKPLRFQLRMSQDESDRLKSAAHGRGRSVAQFVREAVNAYIQTKGA